MEVIAILAVCLIIYFFVDLNVKVRIEKDKKETHENTTN